MGPSRKLLGVENIWTTLKLFDDVLKLRLCLISVWSEYIFNAHLEDWLLSGARNSSTACSRNLYGRTWPLFEIRGISYKASPSLNVAVFFQWQLAACRRSFHTSNGPNAQRAALLTWLVNNFSFLSFLKALCRQKIHNTNNGVCRV